MSNNIALLFKSHRQELEAYLVRRLRDPDVAADLTQETFTRFTEKMQSDGEVIIQSRPYLFRTAHNLAIDYLRQKRHNDTADAEFIDVNDLIDQAPTPDEQIRGQQRLRTLKSVLDALPERTRRVFTLCRLRGLTYRQAAQELQISESSVQKHLAQALKFAMQQLRED